MILWSWRERISVRKIGAGKWLGSLEDSGYMGDDLSREMALGTGRQGISPAKTGAWKWLWEPVDRGFRLRRQGPGNGSGTLKILVTWEMT